MTSLLRMKTVELVVVQLFVNRRRADLLCCASRPSSDRASCCATAPSYAGIRAKLAKNASRFLGRFGFLKCIVNAVFYAYKIRRFCHIHADPKACNPQTGVWRDVGAASTRACQALHVLLATCETMLLCEQSQEALSCAC